MDTRGWMILRVLINRYNGKSGNALLKFLPQDEQEAISKVAIQSDDLKPILQHPQNSLSRFHYSWIKPLIDTFPDRLHPVVVSALTAEQIGGMNAQEGPISNMAKSFIVNKLCYQLKIDEHIPLEYLSETEFSPLLRWTKQELVDLIDYLGLYDLASEVKHIVNRDHLKNIYDCLTPRQLAFLKICMHQKEQLTAPKLGIDPSKQDSAKLKQAVHRRGLSRLGKALCEEQEDFVWTIAHILDMGRGNIILKEYQTKALPKISSVLKQQVLNLMNYLKNE